MAISQSDGSIVLTTKVDTSGMKKSTNELRSEAMKLAAQYRKAGMSQSEAQKKAYQELGITTKETEKATKKTKEYGEQAKKSGSMAKSAFAAVGKAAAAIAVAFAAAAVSVTKQSVDAFAEYEQLVGGVETLFKGSSKKLIEYANQAYKTAGLSANQYMATVTGFSASLLQSLGGDTEKAADIANQALIDMSDNANKMGTSMESIQYAYQGFAKQNYTMLDNLKLGYGGTKTEMERLLKDAKAITGVEYNIDNLADVYTAIGVIQEKLGIAGTTAKEAATTISGSAATMKAAWKNVLVAISSGGDMDAAIENFVDAFDTYFDNMMPVVEKAIHGIGILLEKIAPKLAETVGKAFIKEIPRLTTAIYSMIVGAFKGLYRGIVELFRKETNYMLEEQAEKTEEAAESQEKVTENIKETNKELKKTLAGFDDIQILSAGVAEEEQINPFQSGAEKNVESIIPDGSAYVQEVDETLNAIMKIVYPCLIAIGLILLFTGNIGWGIGFIIAGATTAGAAIANAKEEDMSGAVQMLTTIMGIAGGALLALGIILLWIGGIVGIGVAIGMIITGGLLIVSSVSAQAALNPNDIAAWLSLIMGIAGGALLALGVILCMVGSIPMGVGMIIAGAVSLVSAVALNSDAVVEAIRGPIGVITAIVSTAFIVLGVILLFTGAGIPIGLGLILAGAASLVTVVAVNWNAITDAIKGTFNSIIEWIENNAMLIIGIVLTLIGMFPLGIALILESIKAKKSGEAPSWNYLTDKVKEVWQTITSFWNKNIAPIFTAKWWTDLGKTCINGLIAGFEGGINGIIFAFESMINWIVDGLNKISFDIPDWLGGGHFGIDIPRVSFGRVSIPRLAQGTVVPPNKEFMAILGDNTKEHEIVSPVSTMKQAFMEAMIEMGGNYGSGNTEVVLEIDGREFGRAVVEQGNRENRRIGTRLVIA